MAMEALRIAAKESKFMKFILGGFIFLAVGGLVFTDVGGYFTGGARGTTVATVGDTKIDIRQFDSELRGFLQQTGLTADQAYDAGLVNAFLQGKIDTVLKLQTAEDLNIRPDTITIAKQIKTAFGDADKAQIESILRAQGVSESQMADMVRIQTLTKFANELPNVVANYVPSYMVAATSKIDGQKRSGHIHSIKLKALVEDVAITDSNIMDYYTANASEFTNPETRVFNVGTMTIDMAKKNLPAITDTDVRTYYDNNIDEFTIPEKRTIEQAIIKNPDQAQAVYESVLAGEDLKTAVVNVTGADDAYRALADYDAKGLPDDLSAKAFASTVNAGDVIAPTKTLFGSSIMVVNDIKNQSVPSFKDVQAGIETALTDTATFDALYNKIVDSEDMLDNGAGFKSLVETVGLKTTTTENLSRDNFAMSDMFTKAIEASPSIADELFTLAENGATYPLEIDDETFIVIGVKKINSATVKPLDDVKANIQSTLKTNQTNTLAESKIAQIANDLNNGKPLPDGLKFKKSPFKAMQSNDKNANSGVIFDLNKNQSGYRIDDDTAFISTVTDIVVPTGDDGADIAPIRTSQNAMINSISTDFKRDQTSVKINDQLLEQTYGARN